MLRTVFLSRCGPVYLPGCILWLRYPNKTMNKNARANDCYQPVLVRLQLAICPELSMFPVRGRVNLMLFLCTYKRNITIHRSDVLPNSWPGVCAERLSD